MITVDEAKLREFIDRMLGDLGGAGHFQRTRQAHGPGRALPAGVAGAAGRLRLPLLRSPKRPLRAPPEQATVLADESSPFHMTGAFDIAAALLDNIPSFSRRDNVLAR
jgi:hypothetical protein